jgi:hypothetical protein
VIIFLETHYKRRDDLVAAFSICVKIAPKMFFPNIGREFHSGKIGKSPSEFAVIGDRIHRKRFLPVPLDITNPFTSR